MIQSLTKKRWNYKIKFYSEKAYDKFFAYTFIKITNNSRMGKPGEDLANKFALGVNRFPYDLPNATNMIINYKNYVNNPHHTGNK